ncbi:UDP-N-acetylmuramoyl-L-alanine--D-glutamate ligase [Sulfoacidibacillus ferrooxidans]|uniref:UDP-N-acetylmuramoylalanine--D-glutamate ligase n=1 Tax=Sulfoacidibacillus ferrooxidans TaxID=2005001 RepID=A0A9X1V5N0_9BACL|nr:UDP-N-acetylmuramoyl-L-alanine--D-glutamate ligase [Sulfoacidibacillus ferrooxidans]MCI0181773.1 UDP-N-acetylmuramoylalanine--D-glutamate ligase [Sulfoacidibacillus ferrooxidans]
MDVENRSVLVVGLAKSGVAVAKLLHQLGAHVVVNDQNPKEQVALEVEELERLGISVVTGGHPLELVDACEIMVKNPGISYDRPVIARAVARGIPIFTEVEIASRVITASIIGITGSNGKTTTTTLIGEILRKDHKKVMVAGNIGTALSAVAKEVTADDLLVVELSSFQLQGTQQFHPHIAALLNIYPAHLDYHGTIENYINAKSKLFQNQTASDIAILNRDQQVCVEIANTLHSQVWWVSMEQEVALGAYLSDEWLMLATPSSTSLTSDRIPVIKVADLALRGRHNVQNALFACAVSYAAGASIAAIAKTLGAFAGVEHRMEFVREYEGVTFINDSKATNPQAALQAIQSFEEPIVGILGGLDRGDDLTPLISAVASHMKAVVVLGQSGKRMAEMAQSAGIATVLVADSLLQAVKLATEVAQPGDVVLLSPAAASWDMFASFEERGRIFKEAVHML